MTETCLPPHSKPKIDYILLGCISVIAISCVFIGLDLNFAMTDFSWALIHILSLMWWGIALGIIAVGAMNKIPRDYFTAVMGRSNSFSGLLKACFAGLLLDVCCHGVMVIAAKLYERGLPLAQVMTFLIASPWNSLTLTFILIAMIGVGWTLLFIAGSVVIALVSGLIYIRLEESGVIAPNPHHEKHAREDGHPEIPTFVGMLKTIRISPSIIWEILKDGWHDGRSIIRWILFGAIVAAAMRTFIPQDVFYEWLGPNMVGLLLTLLIATLIEVCSEGSAPIGAEFLHSGRAPGNGFTFLMAGVSTDYTELLVIKEFTKKWAIAFTLPLITVPQILLLGYIMNLAGVE